MLVITLTKGESVYVDDCDFHWLSQRNWYLGSHGYAMCALFGRRGGIQVLMHRLILLAPDTSTVDHINHDTLDNRRKNLRLATQAQQNQNRIRTHGASQYKGVYRRRDGLKWCAQIRPPNSKLKYLGSFEDEVEAALVYDAAAIKHFGEFACPNFQEGKEP